ncbi:MAG: PAS domain-containing protein [Syntrophales bacterium]|nr:PAS domain-containing protein [Syntrophales bacterium]MDY0043619.1 PAS domain-containing protein [Syntrophales bacterium]
MRSQETITPFKENHPHEEDLKVLEKAAHSPDALKRLFAEIIQKSKFGITLVDHRMQLLFVNSAIRHHYHYPHILGGPCYSQFRQPPGKSPCPFCPAYHTLMDGNMHESVVELPRLKGNFLFHVTSWPVFDKRGNISAVFNIIDDITERIRAQELIFEAEKQCWAIFETTGAATAIVDNDMTITRVNRAFEELCACSRNGVEGKLKLTEFIHGNSLDELELPGGGYSYDPEPRLLKCKTSILNRKKGTPVPVFFRSCIIPGTDKRVASFYRLDGVKAGAGNRSGLLPQFSDFLETISDPLIIIDEKWRIAYVNPAGAGILEAEASRLLGSPFRSLTTAASYRNIKNKVQEFTENYGHDRSDTQYLKAGFKIKNSEILEVQIVLRPLADENGNAGGCLCIMMPRENPETVKSRLNQIETEYSALKGELEEAHHAINVLLQEKEKDRQKIESAVASNIREFVIPRLEKLFASKSDDEKINHYKLLQSAIDKLTAPLNRRMAAHDSGLTSREIEVARLVHEGKVTKEIADLLNISTGTVEYHRHNIRSKLGLGGKKKNLRTHLLTFLDE